jgi:hypothetical protein
MTKEEFKEMERVYLQWLHEHPKGDYSYKAFSHMSRTLEFAKYWSKLHQPTVISSVCEHPLFLPYTPIDGNEIKQCANCGYIKQTDL